MKSRPNEDRELVCDMTAEEISQRAREATTGLLRVEELRSQAKSAAQSYKAQIEAIGEALHIAANEVLTGMQRRMVPCEWTADLARACWVLVRKDTGQVVTTETMTTADLQAMQQEQLPGIN